MSQTQKRSSPAATRLKLLLTTLCLLVLAQAFNGGLSLSSLEKLFLGSMVSRYQVVANDFLGSIQKAMRFGKPLENFVGIRPLMDEVTDELPDLTGILVADKGGRVLYGSDTDAEGKTWPDLAGDKRVPVAEEQGRPNTFKAGDTYYVEFPLDKTDRTGAVQERVGTVVFAFPESNVRGHLTRVMMDNLDVLLLVSLAGAALMGLGLQFLLPLDAAGFSRLRLYLILIIGLGGAQIVYSWYNVNTFRDNYIKVARDNTEQVARMLRTDVEFLLNKGLRINRLFKIDEHLGGIVKATDEVREISILDADNRVLYKADAVHGPAEPEDGEMAPPSGDDAFYDLRMGLFSSRGGQSEVKGSILVHLDKKHITDRVREIVLDSITVSVIGVLFLLELVILFLIYIRKAVTPAGETATGPEADAQRYGIIRPVAFLFLFAMDLSITFIPLHMERVFEPLWGLSKDIVLGLPISVEMFFAGIFVITAGLWMDRRGWKEPFFIGLALAGGGCAWSGLAPDMLQFIASRALIGSGYGLALMAAEGFVVDNTGPDSRARGITHLFAGVYAGSLCGGAAGAMLADRLGYRPVFLVSALIMALVIVAVGCIVRGPSRRPAEVRPEPEVQRRPLTAGGIARFFLDRNIFAAVFLSIVPAALLVVGFINYLLPIYLNRIGTSQSDIGRVLMVYNICLIYMAPLLGNAIDKARFKGRYVVLSGIVAAVGLMGFWFQGGLFMTAFAMFMLGVSSSFGFGAQNAFVLNLKATHEAGHGAAMGMTNAMERIGQVLGPLVLGALVVALGVENGIAATGAAVLVLSLGFMLMARERGNVMAGSEAESSEAE